MREHPALRAAATHGLGHDVAAAIEPGDVGEVLALTQRDGMTGFLAGAILDGSVETDEETATRVIEIWQRTMTVVVLVEALAVRTSAVLDGACIRWRLTKGAATAHLDYGEQLAQRTFGDVDLVVHPDDWAGALDALASAGLRRPAPELRPGYDLRFGKGATLVDDHDYEVDLHLRFAIGRFGVRSRMRELFDRCDSIELAGRPIPTLARSDRLLHACHHLVTGGFSGYRVARDVAQLLLVSDVDWQATVATAESWGVEAVVSTGIDRAWQRLGLKVDHPAHDWASAQPICRGDSRAIEVFTEERPFREQALTAVPAIPWRRVPAYLLALGLPSSNARRSGRNAWSHGWSRLRALVRHRPPAPPGPPTG